MSLILVDLVESCQEIHFFRFFHLCAVYNLPTKVQDWKHSNHRIREEKGRDIPIPRQKDSIAAYKSHDCRGNQRNIGSIGLPPTLVWERFSWNTLGYHSFPKTGIGKGDDGKVDKLRSSYLPTVRDFVFFEIEVKVMLVSESARTRLTNQSRTTDALFDTWRKARSAINMTTVTQ